MGDGISFGISSDGKIRSLEKRFATQKTHPRPLPIIAMTAHTMKEDEGKCMAAGMNAYISKPVNQEKLFKTLIRLIRDKELEEKAPMPLEPDCPSPVPPSSTPLPKQVQGIELERAVKALGIGSDIFIHILNTFFKNHEGLITEMETAWKKNDREKVIGLAHSLKGSAAGIGSGIGNSPCPRGGTRCRGGQHGNAIG